ncbi:MAG TPA: heavy metal-binding domain-containing protein, partial [Burkholderiales bacterium]|nr:heavy metal-binding domain-containing protein [Burkholderiales bacterium]
MNDHAKHDSHGSGHAHAGQDSQKVEAGPGHAPCHGGHDTASQKVTDPVCNMKVDPKTAKGGSHEHAGVRYYFCGAGCAAKFKADPEKYLGAEARAPQPAVPGATYTCPMHPEIVRDAPGDCPICGMALVPIAGSGETEDTELRDLTRRFWIGTALSIPLVVLAMAPMIGYHEPFGLAPRARGLI